MDRMLACWATYMKKLNYVIVNMSENSKKNGGRFESVSYSTDGDTCEALVRPTFGQVFGIGWFSLQRQPIMHSPALRARQAS